MFMGANLCPSCVRCVRRGHWNWARNVRRRDSISRAPLQVVERQGEYGGLSPNYRRSRSFSGWEQPSSTRDRPAARQEREAGEAQQAPRDSPTGWRTRCGVGRDRRRTLVAAFALRFDFDSLERWPLRDDIATLDHPATTKSHRDRCRQCAGSGRSHQETRPEVDPRRDETVTPTISKIRRMLLRALERADVEDDVKTVLEISRMLLPLEQQIDEEKKAQAAETAATGPLDHSTLTLDELVARSIAINDRLMEMRNKPAPSVETPPTSSPIVTPVSAPESSRLEEATPPVEPSCQYCHQPHRDCAEMRQHDLTAWRSLHFYDPR